MVDFILDQWNGDSFDNLFGEMASLWNTNAVDRHAFYPWTGELLSRLLAAGGKGVGRLIAARNDRDELIGFTHVTILREEGYPRAGAVEMLLVDKEFRKRGVGTALLREAIHVLAAQAMPVAFVDALGAWPFGYAYNTLADGSERSGVFLDEDDLYRLFGRAGFVPVRKSLVMRADLASISGRPVPRGMGFYIGVRRMNTWLDRVFRGRELWDHELLAADGRVQSRAIFGFMEGESRHEGAAVFSLFGVNTPGDRQRKGYAGVNISNMMEHVRGLGGEVMELHVYADNEPALALYRSLGFKPVAETMMMHLRI